MELFPTLNSPAIQSNNTTIILKEERLHLPCDTSIIGMNYFIHLLTLNIQQVDCTTYSANKQTFNTNKILQKHRCSPILSMFGRPSRRRSTTISFRILNSYQRMSRLQSDAS
uniref:Ovule protein n=1 Tax=Heterorhabditis bacteriophora TaxID=37862 RepID=A0A1I7WV91_HETBA